MNTLPLPLRFDNPEDDLVVEIPLLGGYITVIDAVDAELIPGPKWKASPKQNQVYVYRIQKPYVNKRGTSVYLHSAIMSRILGRPLVETEKVDHIDRNALNNRRNNLRLATTQQNARNQSISASNKTGYKGVMIIDGWIKAKITVNYRTVDLGRFATIEDAAIAYNHAAVERFGEYANLNPIEDWQNRQPTSLTRTNTLFRNNTSGYPLVFRDRNRWRAKIRRDGKLINLGNFDTPEEAHQAQLEAMKNQ